MNDFERFRGNTQTALFDFSLSLSLPGRFLGNSVRKLASHQGKSMSDGHDKSFWDVPYKSVALALYFSSWGKNVKSHITWYGNIKNSDIVQVVRSCEKHSIVILASFIRSGLYGLKEIYRFHVTSVSCVKASIYNQSNPSSLH